MSASDRPLLSRRSLPLFFWTITITALQRRVMRVLERLGRGAL